MANSIDVIGNIIHIYSIDEDWNYLTTFPGMNHGLSIHWIRQTLGQANDRVVLKWANDAGKTFWDVT